MENTTPPNSLQIAVATVVSTLIDQYLYVHKNYPNSQGKEILSN